MAEAREWPVAYPVMRASQGWTQLDRTLVFANCLLQVDVSGVRDFSHRIVRLRQVRVQLQRLKCRGPSFRTGILRIGAEIIGKQNIRLPQARVGERIVRVAGN